ncbi:M16 family metallopeptidase [Anaerorudis cellulosivorans]|uniref:M16 family metallopeptidase n=1 Tax=Anaerorudis cellulosivorans TaxID=3397862 RepID=UPI00221EB582|nr:M16 family metallopeptidase [Seramator thermalis]MCW1735348.1 insulinase family protein [Seramator thermalis]
MKKALLFLFLAINLASWSQQIEPLPIDPDVRKGTLENGLTYYIRHNNLPENRADFYIAQKVGSMQEEDHQAGLAHFLEHMAFNGTKNFPGKSMLDYLEKNGVKFGANVNAYTSFDETVYYLTNVPMVREGLLDSCLLILHDWSNAISLETEEIEKERGVIREEWRTRGGAQSRILEKLLPEMYKGSKYADRLPIGKIEVINNFKPEELRAYYKKWYRPDLQGIIVVGNVDVDQVEAKIKNLFSPIELDPNRPKREYYPVPDNEDPIVAMATDPEATRINLMVFYKHDPVPDEVKLSQAGLMVNYINNVVSQMINERLQEIVQKPDAPFTSAYAYDDNYFIAKTKDAWTVVGNSSENKIKDALAAMIRETERMKRFGFTVSEYDRARENMLKSYENAYNNRDKQRNASYTGEYLGNFLNSEPIPGIEYEYEMIQTIASQISVEIINQTVAQLIGDKNVVISVSGPEKEGIAYPTKDELVALFNEVNAEKIGPYQEEISNEPLVPNRPEPGKIRKTEKNEILGTTLWTLGNGMKVVLKSTDFKNDEILMTSTSEGGTSIYAEEDPLNSKVMNQVMTLGGVGNFSVTNLRKVLAGKRAAASPSISLTTQSMNGSSSIKDFETMLQLVYLYFTAPRSDKDAFASYIQRMETQLKNQEADPMVAFSDSVTYALYGNNPMTKRLKVDDLPKIDYEKIMKMYKQSFSNPGSFTFTFVGNIDEEKVKPIIEQYLASLPGTPTKTEFKKIPMNYRKGLVNNLFEREMQLPKASVFNGITGTIDFTQKNRMLMSMLGQILDIVYTEKIREDEGGTYGVYAGGGISRYPKNQSLLQIMYDTDPVKMEKLNAIVLDELKLIAANGPRETDFSKVKEFMRKKYFENIKENNYWLNILDNYYFYGEDDHSNYLKILESITPSDVKIFVKEFLSQNNRATVIMMPKE